MELNEIPKSKIPKFKKELYISESERYFHRDKNLQPYWYTFNIDSVHFLKSKELFLLSNQIIIEQLEKIHDEIPKILSEEKTFISLKDKNEGVFNIIMNGFDDTIGSIIQQHLATNMINDKSVLSVCGYKRTHPLEDIIIFTISLNRNNKIFQLNKPQQILAIVDVFAQTCNELIQIFSLIKAEANKKL